MIIYMLLKNYVFLCGRYLPICLVAKLLESIEIKAKLNIYLEWEFILRCLHLLFS